MKLYKQVATALCERIEQGYYQSGQKLPSIRVLSTEYDVSISTIQEAYRTLERKGLIEARPKSGFYVLNRQRIPNLPDVSRPVQRPLEVSNWEEVLNLLSNMYEPNVIQLSRAIPDLNAKSLIPLRKILSELNRTAPIQTFSYEDLRGSEKLRIQLSRLMVDSGSLLHPDDIVTTTGCQEALSVSLRAICSPGDIVAVDSPSFYGSMLSIKAHGLKTIEIPTHPETGISLEALELALDQWPIKALQLTPTCNNPLGYTMPEENKKKLVALAARYDLTIIEDDIYGDLSYQYPRPRTIKSYDTDGRVMLCSSFSKTLAPGLRVGWVAPGRHLDQVIHMKYVSTACSATLPQLALAEFIAQGGYERHVRKMRSRYQHSRDMMIDWVERYFPTGTRISYPQGGFLLWVELPAEVDTAELNKRTTRKGVSLAPGILFSASGKYRNCMRLNFTERPCIENEKAVELLGQESKKLISELQGEKMAVFV
ncbi:PLP-dependent aminotransferase family protein [Nitrincola sp. MINF-07-Sa-05]|uniref:aminotransferase-like domain-containing protein n=1 Tax=Nitrincola salilacus TaxID=3400273 RepID=UPI0039184B38